MDTLSYKTKFSKIGAFEKGWVVIDAENAVLGRLCSRAALVIRGKHKPFYTPHIDCGDNVIILNADKIRLTGKKWTDKEYIRHTGYPGGQRVATPREVAAKSYARIVEHAIKGMLPKNRLGRRLFHNLYVYEGTSHPHEAQNPKEIKL